MPQPTDAEIADLKAKYSGTKLSQLDYDNGESAIVVKHPSKAEWDRLTSTTSANRADAPRALETFVRACLVWPDSKAFDVVVADRPALIAGFGEQLSDLAGQSEKIRAKKL